MARPPRITGFQGLQLRRARREKGLSQEELAANLGVHRATLVRWESDVSDPPPEQAEQIAKILNQELSWFYPKDDLIAPEDPRWIDDPWLSSFPLDQLQRRTALALRSLRQTPSEIARACSMPRNRIERLLGGEWPNAQEIQRFREVFGERFNPAQAAARRRRPLTGTGEPMAPEVVTPAESTSIFSDGEKLDILLQRVHRIEQKLERFEALAEQWMSGQISR